MLTDMNGNEITERCYAFVDYEGFAQELYSAHVENGEVWFTAEQYDCDKWADPTEFSGASAQDLAKYLIPA